MKRIFIDGKAGTTGLRIYERLQARKDIELLTLSETERKDPICRKEMLNKSDIVFLCLPDDAAIEAVSMIENPNTVVIDTSTAHRTNPSWVYGFPELTADIEEKIKESKRIAVPGCHASGFIALVAPLVCAGILDPHVKLTCHSITGYSGGGRKMINQYQNRSDGDVLSAPRQYALTQNHKHLKEMRAVSGIMHEPIFTPIVSDFYSGMMVTVPLFSDDLEEGYTVEDIKNVYRTAYSGNIVMFKDCTDSDGMLPALALAGKDSMCISVFGNENRILLTAVYDNLGKGSSGAAVEILNIILGSDKTTGLAL